ncbi:uncharacterized protein METZ01_LOCUS359684, partial [marine metagenome]
GAPEEGNLISSIISDGDFSLELYSGATAQEKILSDVSAPGTLHIATHGFFLAPESGLEQRLVTARRGTALTPPPPMDNPLLRAGLAFAGANRKIPYLGEIDNRNDGILTAFEILGLDLSPTALVVLSACETGLGEIHEGEGVYGLRRSFQEAGAGTVISSLWEISDAGTSVLMEGFYGRLLDGESPADALRNVQLELLDSPAWQHPYIWASFTTVVDSPL